MRKKMFIIFAIMAIFAGTAFAGSNEVIYDSGDVQKAAYAGTLATTVNYTDGTITDPATKIDLAAGYTEANMSGGAGQELGLDATFSVDVYGDSSNTDIRFNFYVHPFDGDRFYLDVPIDFTGWQTFTVNLADMSWYTGGVKTQAEALNGPVDIFQLGGPFGGTAGTVYIDNAKLTIETLSYNEEVNLIQNGDAEAGVDLLNWYYGTLPPPVLPLTLSDFVYEDHSDTDVSDPGTDSFVLDNTLDAWASVEMRTLAIPTDPNEPYLLKFWYKTLPGFNMIDSAGLRADFRTWTNGHASYIGGTSLELAVTDGAWVQVVQEVVTPGDSGVEILDIDISMNLHGFADGVVLIDEIELYDTNCGFVPNQELYTNGGFETGDMTDWWPGSNVSVTSAVSSEGTYSLQCDTAGAPSWTVHNSVSVAGIEHVFFSVDVMTEVGAAAPAASYAQLRFYDNETGAYVYNPFISIPLTEGAWTTLSGQYEVPPEADLVDVFLHWDGSELAYFDNLSLRSGASACDQAYDITHLRDMAQQWLTNDFQPLLPDNSIDGFEGYADQAAMEVDWGETSGTYASVGTPEITLLTNPADAHSGSNALRFTYNNYTASGVAYTEFHHTLPTAIDLNQYDEIRVWVNRHASNSDEELLYVKFYQDAIDINNIAAWNLIYRAGGSTTSPVGWDEWVIDLNSLDGAPLEDLDNVVGLFFGVADNVNGKGSGVIDFDDITLVNTIPNCGSNPPSWDLSGDCTVNYFDFATIAEFWIGN